MVKERLRAAGAFLRRMAGFIWRFCKARPFVSAFVALLLLLFLPPLFKSKPVPVFDYVQLQRGLVERTVTASGRLQPRELVMVGSEVSGLVLAVDVDVGDKVRKGQRLAQIEDATLESDWRAHQANVKSEEANLKSVHSAWLDAERDVQRFKALRTQGYTTQRDFEQVLQRARAAKASYQAGQTDLASARASEQRSRINYSRARIIAPIDGIVIERYINKGQTLASNFQIPTLFQVASDLSAMKLEVYIDEVDMAHIKVGDKARFTVDTFPDDHFTGTVTQISNAPSDINGATAYKVTVQVQNPQNKLRPGMTATVTIVTHHFANVLRLPLKAENFGKSYDPKKAEAQSSGWGIKIQVVRSQKESPQQSPQPIALDSAHRVAGEKAAKIKIYAVRQPHAQPEAVEVTRWFTGDDYIAVLTDLPEGTSVAVEQK